MKFKVKKYIVDSKLNSYNPKVLRRMRERINSHCNHILHFWDLLHQNDIEADTVTLNRIIQGGENKVFILYGIQYFNYLQSLDDNDFDFKNWFITLKQLNWFWYNVNLYQLDTGHIPQ